MAALSDRLLRVVEALPLEPGLRVLEVGGAPGAAAREVARRVGPTGRVLVVDRSAKGVSLTLRGAAAEVALGTMPEGVLSARVADAASVELLPGEAPYDLAFACRVGVLDGRHPAGHEAALSAIRRMLVPGGSVFVDTGDPLRRL